MYEKIVNKLMEQGYSEDTSNRIAEVITDYGWETIRNILNEL
jgi:hypothetical protein